MIIGEIFKNYFWKLRLSSDSDPISEIAVPRTSKPKSVISSVDLFVFPLSLVMIPRLEILYKKR